MYSSATYLHCGARKACVTLFLMHFHNPGTLRRETREQTQQKLVSSNCSVFQTRLNSCLVQEWYQLCHCRYKVIHFTIVEFTSLRHTRPYCSPCNPLLVHGGGQCVTSPKNVCIIGYGFTRQTAKTWHVWSWYRATSQGCKQVDRSMFTNSLLPSEQTTITIN